MYPSRSNYRTGVARRGVVLLIVLVVVIVLALAAYTFCELSIGHRRAANAVGRRMQVEAFAESGVQFTLQVVSEATRSGNEQELFENPALFQEVAVLARQTSQEGGGFSIISPECDARGELAGIRFGLEDESNRLNLNLLKAIADSAGETGQQMLTALPGMTPEVANSILDWLDADDEPRPGGAENDYYASLDPPYAAANGQLHSIGELLLVRGVTPQLLFGQDRNRNYILEQSELEPAHGENSYGWAAHLTLHSKDRDGGVAQIPVPPVDVNQDDLHKLYDELFERYGKESAMYIVAFRQHGPTTSPPALGAATLRELDLSQPARFKIMRPLDLIGQSVPMTLVGDTEPVVIASPFKDDADSIEFSQDEVGEILVGSPGRLPGRINIICAPRVVLRTIPGIDDAAVERILSHRDTILENEQADETDELWPLTSGIVSVEQMRAMAPYINLGGCVYRAQVVGHFFNRAGSARAVVIVDASGETPRLVLRTDLSQLGSGTLLHRIASTNGGTAEFPVAY